MIRRSPIIGALALALVLGSGPASAADPRAEQLFREGRAALDAGRLDEACERFEESLKLESVVGPLLNLADCNERRGALVRSLELWHEGLRALRPDDPRRALASRRIEDLESRIPRLVVHAPAGASVLVDGRKVEPGQPHPVDPGTRTVVVTTSAGSRTEQIAVQERKAEVLDMREPASQPPSPGPAPEAAEGSPLLVPGIVALGVGGAGLIAFGVTGILYLGDKATVDEGCPDRACTTTEAYDAGQRGQTLAIVNLVALGVGVAGAGVGAVLLWQAGEHGSGTEASLHWTGDTVQVDGRF